jgi:hypothetical protein
MTAMMKQTIVLAFALYSTLAGNRVLGEVAYESPSITLRIISATSPVIEADGSVTNFIVQRSEDLTAWHSFVNIFSKGQIVRLGDLTTPGQSHISYFYRAAITGQSVEEMLAKWRAVGLTNYTFKFTRVCMCDHLILNGTVTVKNGQAVAVADANDRGLPIADPDFRVQID